MPDTLEAILSDTSIIRQRWLPTEMAVQEVVAFEQRFGSQHLRLACHAALPLILTPELVNLIHINFLDEERIPWVAEADFLLSSLCRPIDERYYEVEPSVREVLLVELENRFGWQRPLELANFLLTYLFKKPDLRQRTDVMRTHKWIAQAYTDPDQVIEEIKAFLEETLSSEVAPLASLSGQIQIATMLQVTAEPLKQASSYKDYQYLVNNSRVLAERLYGDKEILREAVKQERASGGMSGTEISPILLRQLVGSKEPVKQPDQQTAYNPYNYHVAARDDAMFFGRKDLLKRLLEGLSAPVPVSAVIFGGNRSGKTSLLFKLFDLLNGDIRTSSGQRLIPCRIDLQRGRPITCSDDFFLWVLEELGETLERQQRVAYGEIIDVLHTHYYENSAKGPVIAFSQAFQSLAIDNRSLRVIIITDQAQSILTIEWSDELKANLRILLTSSPISDSVALVMAGSTSMYANVTQRNSSLENVFDRYILPTFSYEETLTLARQTNNYRISEEVAEEIWHQTGGHPCLTQYILHELWRELEGKLEDAILEDVQRVTKNFDDRTRLFSIWTRNLGEAGSALYRFLSEQEKLVSYQAIREQFSTMSVTSFQSALDALVYHGVIHSHGGGRKRNYQVAGQMYQDWFLSAESAKSIPRLRASEFFKQARFRIEELGAKELLLTPQGQGHPQADLGRIYVQLITGRSPTGGDISTVREAAKLHYGNDLSHRVALVISDRRPEPSARYRLYEIRQREGLTIVPLDISLFSQIELIRSVGDILTSKIDQVTGQNNLYNIREPISSDLSFFGRDRVLSQVINLLNAGQPVGIFGLRKTGKTSLIQRVQSQLAQQRPVALVNTYTISRQQGIWSLYADIIANFANHLQRYRPEVTLPKLKLWPKTEAPSLAMADAFMQDLQALHTVLGDPEKKDRLLLVVEGIDQLLPRSTAAGYESFNTFFGQLRVANQSAQILDYLLVGLDAAVNRTERWEDHHNTLYNVLHEVWMPPMDPDNVYEMIESLGSQMGVHFKDEALSLLASCGGGQPFVIRQICSRAVEDRLGQGTITITLDQANMAVEEFVLDDLYLREMWRTELDETQRGILRQMAQVSEPLPRLELLPASQRQEALAALSALEDYTLIRRNEDHYIIAWDVLRRWIRCVELGLKE